MDQVVVGLAVTISLITGFCSGNRVNQSPPNSISDPRTNVTFECSHNVDTYYQINWYQQTHDQGLVFMGYLMRTDGYPEPDLRHKISIKGNANKGQDNTMTLLNTLPNDTAIYFCAAWDNSYSQAHFGAGTKLTVLEEGLKVTAPTVKLLPPSKSEPCDKVQKKREEKSVTLVCLATNFYPDHVTVSWKVSGVIRTKGVGTDNNALRSEDKMYSITSRLRIGIKEWANPNTWVTCVVSFFNGTHNVDSEDSVKGQLVPGMVDPDSYVNSAQTAKFAYSIFIAKSCLFGLFIFFFVRKISRGSKDKW